MERRMKVCEHCREGFALASTGRPPRFCSSTCRKNAWHKAKLDEAVAAAMARAVAAERRRSNRGNETRQPAGNRGNETRNETPSQVTPPIPPPADPAPTPRVDSPPRPRSHFASWVATEARAFVAGAMSGQQGALFDDEVQPDARPETDAR